MSEENLCPHCGKVEPAAAVGTAWRCSGCDGTYMVGRSKEEAGAGNFQPPPASGFTTPPDHT